MGKVIFVGGIHGVGKSTLCNTVANIHNMYTCSASSIIKQFKGLISKDSKNVKDVDANQTALLCGLKQLQIEHEIILLDGHFMLINSHGELVRIQDNVFRDLGLSAIVMLTNSIDLVIERLYGRDGNIYDKGLLEKMQKLEVAAAEENAEKLGIPFLEINLYADKESERILSSFVLTNI